MKVIKKISTISGYASGVLIALIWALMIAEVIMRNIFHHPILGCSEICVFMYVSASYFGFSFTQIYKGHITVDLLYTNLKPAGQRALDIISLVLESILFVAFTYCSWMMTVPWWMSFPPLSKTWWNMISLSQKNR